MFLFILDFIISIFEASAAAALAITLFRFNVTQHIKDVITIGTSISVIWTIQVYLLNQEPYVFVTQFLSFILLIKYIFELSLIKSVVIGTVGYVAFGCYQLTIVLGMYIFNISKNHSTLMADPFLKINFQLFESITLSLLIIYLQRRKIGFTKIVVNTKKSSKYSFLLPLIWLSLVFSIMQIVFATMNNQLVLLYSLILLSLLLLISLFTIYYNNKREYLIKGIFTRNKNT